MSRSDQPVTDQGKKRGTEVGRRERKRERERESRQGVRESVTRPAGGSRTELSGYRQRQTQDTLMPKYYKPSSDGHAGIKIS